MRNTGLEETQAGIKIAGRNINNRTLAWKVPWTEKPGRLQSMGSLRVGHDWATSFSLFIKRLFSSSSLSAISVVSSAYLSLFIFLSEILIPVFYSSSLGFHMVYSAQKLNKQGDNIQPCYTPVPILNQFIVPCLVLTVTFDPYTGFTGDRSGGLVFPSLSEFSTVCCDPPSQKLWHSQKLY